MGAIDAPEVRDRVAADPGSACSRRASAGFVADRPARGNHRSPDI
jgi:hypothetical protein